MDYVVRVDDTGRIIIPKKVRSRYGIDRDDVLLLSTSRKGFVLKKDCVYSKYRVLLNKVKFLENKYNLRVIVTDNKRIVYDSCNLFVGGLISSDVVKIINSDNIFKGSCLRVSDDMFLNDTVICKSIFEGLSRGCLIFASFSDVKLCKMLFDVIG